MSPARLFESYEISPCRFDGDKDITVTAPHLAEFWTLYGWRDDCAEAIGDFDSLAQAADTYMAITGFPIPENGVVRYLGLPAR